MQRTFIKIIVFLSVFFLLELPIGASELTDSLYDSLEEPLSEFQNSLPSELQSLLEKENVVSFTQMNEKTFFSLLFEYFSSDLEDVLKTFSSLLLLILLSSLLNLLQKSLASDSVERFCKLLTPLVIGITTFEVMIRLTKTSVSFLTTLCETMKSLSPLMTVFYTLCGHFETGVIANASLLLFISTLNSFFIDFLLPIIKVCIGFSLVSSLSTHADFSSLGKTLKTTYTSVLVFCMSVFSFVLHAKTTFATGKDTLSARSAKFIISGTIPIIGSGINDSLSSIASGIGVIKNNCGIIFLILILLLIIPRILSLLLYRLCFSLLFSCTELMGGEQESKILKEGESLCGFLVAIVCASSTLFIVALSIFIRCNVAIS